MHRFPAICLVLLAVSACKDDTKPSTQSAASAAPTSSAIPDDFVVNSFFAQGKGIAVAIDGSAGFGEPGAEPSGDGKIKLIDPGGDPKVKLAYNFVLNKSQTVLATVTEEVSGPDIPEGQGKQPPIVLTLVATPKKKDGAKTQIEMKITKFEMVGAPADVASKLAPLQTALGKVAATFTVGGDGDNADLELSGTESLQRGPAEQILSMVARVQSVLYVPLPSVAVGPGARWKTSTTQEATTIDSTYTYVGKTDASYEFKLDTGTMAAPKTMQDPRSGKKLTLEIKGSSNYDLTTLLDGPVYKGKGDSQTSVAMSENQGAKRMNNEKMTLVIEKPASK